MPTFPLGAKTRMNAMHSILGGVRLRMFKALGSLFTGSKGPSSDVKRAHTMPPIEVTAPVYIVGDVHGSLALLEGLLERIDRDLSEHDMGQPYLVFLGDYIDRGEDGAGVLKLISMLAEQMPQQVVCLCGNHEAMMRDFLADPATYGRRWLRNGGLQTLSSFGLGGLTERANDAALLTAAAELRDAMPASLEPWLGGLPSQWRCGNLVCVHAALDPLLPPEAQSETVCFWGHSGFLEGGGRRDGLWVAHGHTIVDQAGPINGRLPLDTGAYYTGVLTAAALAPGQPLRLIQTGQPTPGPGA